MELMPEPAPWTGPLDLPQGSGRGKSVLVLGSGIAGLAAAYELTRAGFKLSDANPMVVSPPPRLREHTDAVLTELGYANSDIERLRAAGTV